MLYNVAVFVKNELFWFLLQMVFLTSDRCVEFHAQVTILRERKTDIHCTGYVVLLCIRLIFLHVYTKSNH